MTYIITLLSTLCVLLLPGDARAWTEAQVTSVSAQLDVTDPALARVDLAVGVRVVSGWLSRFELMDLDAGLTPLPDAAAELIGADGRRYAPALSVVDAVDVVHVGEEPSHPDVASGDDPAPLGGSSVRFAFPQRAAAPQPGDYVLHFAYTTAHWDQHRDAAGARWSLPRWPERLSDVTITVLAPPGSRSLSTREDVDSVDTRATDGRVELRYRRLELPRTQSLAARFALPGPALRAAPPAPAPIVRPALRWLASALLARAPDLSSLALGVALGALWLLKRRLVQRRCREQGLIARPLVSLGAWRERSRLSTAAAARLRDRAGAGLCAAAVIGFERFPVLAAVGGALGSLSLLEVISRRCSQPPPRGSDRAPCQPPLRSRGSASTQAPPRCADRTSSLPPQPSISGAWLGLLDASTPQGGAACLACYFALLALYAHNPAAVGCAALLAAPLFVSALGSVRAR